MTILKVKALTKMYNEKNGISNLNIEIEKNDIVLLLGPNGAGKTTAFKSILDLSKSKYEKIEILGINIIDNREESLKKIGAMISKPGTYNYLTGYEHYKILEFIYENVDKKRIDEVLKIVGLSDSKNELVSSYSSGMKQRLDIGRAIIHKPNLLILDEPFNGMDIEGKYDFKKLLKDMQKDYDLGIFISSHMVSDFESFANKVVIIYEGHTLFNGLMSEVKDSSLSLEEFYLEKLKLYKSKED